MVFVSNLRDALAREAPELAGLGRAVTDHWPAALMGSEGPDGWFFTPGKKRPDTHILDTDEPATWAGAMDRWLDRHRDLRPGREQAPETQAFMVGYLSHLGLDTWGEQYQHPDLPAAARAAAPVEWFPEQLGDRDRVRAALRRLGEERFPEERSVTVEQLDAVRAPAVFEPDAVRRVAVGILPSLPLSDPWEISRVNPLRETPRDEATRVAWQREREKLPQATDAEYTALLAGATAFTLDLIRKWW